MKNPVPRVAAVHGLAGYGRASLSVVIPVISTMGFQVCPLPTGILSTHGAFEGYRFVDMTDSLPGFIDHWKELRLEFDAVYSGFLGSPEQIEVVSRFIEEFRRPDQLVVIDPVMGDNGRSYGLVADELIAGMRDYYRLADVITPNLTEAAFLLGREYRDHITQGDIKKWVLELAEAGPRMVIVTSVPLEGVKAPTAVVAYDRLDGRFWRVNCSYIPAYYPGTGDIFTSVVTGSILGGDSLPIALERAVQFVSTAIRASFGYNRPSREGGLLERVLDNLRAPITAGSYEILE